MKPHVTARCVSGTKGMVFSKNAGYTILEMVIVVTILAVGMAIIGLSINTIFSLEMRQCTKEIMSELGKEKVASMTKSGDIYMRLYQTSSGIYIDKYENDVLVDDNIKVGTAKLSIKYCSTTNTAGTLLDADGIVIAFNRSNGSFKTIGQAWAMFDDSYSPLYPEEHYTKLVIAGSKSSNTVVLWPDTGKFNISG